MRSSSRSLEIGVDRWRACCCLHAMGLLQSERSSALRNESDHAELNEFDLESGRRAEPLYVPSADGSLSLFAPEKELHVFSVIEQYGPSEPPGGGLIASARPLSPWWSATFAGAVLVAGVSTGLLLGTQVLPELPTTHVQLHRESNAEAPSSPTPMAIVSPLSPPARLPDRAREARPQPVEPVTRLATDSGRELEADELRRAFASLDTQDVQFEQCAVRVPALDRVVIRCHARRGEGGVDGDWSAGPPAEWTVDFNRALNRWQVVSAPAL